MSDKVNHLAENFFVSPQLYPGDIEQAKALGVTLIINNRPDGEEDDQPGGAEIERTAKSAGLAYVAIPVGPAGITSHEIDEFDRAIEENDGAALGFCLSGTRSAALRAHALARKGFSIDGLIAEAASAGFLISGRRAQLEALASHAQLLVMNDNSRAGGGGRNDHGFGQCHAALQRRKVASVPVR